MASDPVLHGALDACKAHVTHTNPILQRYCEQMVSPDGDIMSQAKSSQCGLWMRQCSRMGLATRSAAWGERPLHCCV